MQIENYKYHGLTSNQVKKRIDEGKVNTIDNQITKSYKQIFLDNTITFFNILNIALLSLLLFVGSYKNTLFIFIIITNTLAGIYQEIKAKKTLDRLAILTKSSIEVIRDNQIIELSFDKIVLDDYIILTAGMQIPADCILLEGHMETNESLLTGESDAILKQDGDILYSGSFITSGKGICQVTKVGSDCYSASITKEAKQYKKHNSKLNESLNMILKYVSIVIIPLGVLLFLKQYIYGLQSFNNAVISTVAAILGMIPEGLVLLTSVALTISVLRLAKQKTLVQELFCIETLARIDTLCLDKTGTITEGTMKVEYDIKLKNVSLEEIVGNLMNSLDDSNVTSLALKQYYPCINTYSPCYVIPFSSNRKYSGTSYYQIGTYYIGAYQFLFPKGNEDLEEKCSDLSKQGYRVLVIGHCDEVVIDEQLPSNLSPIGIIVLSDVIRENINETLDYFYKQGVNVKVISGDDPQTVSSIALKAGVRGAKDFIDASLLNNHQSMAKAVEKYTVFGRVTPQQKKELILLLKEYDHVVAMTGDGVNDVLAFKVADCSIAMFEGSDAAKSAANLVLLDNNFNAMPHIVNEGRRVINNITMSASMFLIKTIFSAIITLATILFGQAYPFEPIQLSIISACGVGIPTFFLTYEVNFKQIKKDFLETVIENSFPTALTIAIGTTLITNLGLYFNQPAKMLATVCILFTGWNYTLALLRIYQPMSNYRKLIIYATQFCYFIAMYLGQSILGLTDISFNWLLLLLALIVNSTIFVDISTYCFKKIIKKYFWKKRL